MQEWKVLPEYPEYEVSSLGKIRTIDRKDSRGYLRKSKVLKQTLDSGYYTVGVGKLMPNQSSRKYVTERVHRLVCMAFYGTPEPDKSCALHKNDIKTDNRLENLYWGSRSDNTKDMYKNNHRDIRGENNPAAKLDKETILKIRQLYKARSKEFGAKALSKQFNIPFQSINNIVQRITWSHI